MKFIRIPLLTLITILFIAQLSWAANIYVRSTDGSDSDNGSTWALAKATVAGALAIATNADIIWVSNNHAESAGANITWTFPTTEGLRILCGDDSAEPPTALATTGTVAVGGNFAFVANGFAYIYGLTITSGTGNNGNMSIARTTAGPHGQVWDSCFFDMTSNNAGVEFRIGSQSGTGSDAASLDIISSSLRLETTGQTILLGQGRVYINDLTLDSTSAAITSLFSLSTGLTVDTLIENSDFSDETITNLLDHSAASSGTITFRNVKFGSLTPSTGTKPNVSAARLIMHNCDSADTNYRFSENYWQGSTVQQTGTLVRTDGATNGTTPISWKMTATKEFFQHPLPSPAIVAWNETTGSSLDITIEGLVDKATNLKNNHAWIECSALTTSGFPLGTKTSTRMANIITTPADLTSSSVTWDTTGLTNPNKFKLVATLTPQEKGPISCQVMSATIDTVYIDPLLTIE